MMEVMILPAATKLDNNVLYGLSNDITREFENKVKVSVGATIDPDSDPEFRSAYDRHRNQWDSTKLLRWFLKKFNPSREKKILGILDLDAYSDGLNFVLGEAFRNGGMAAIYLPRLKEEFYRLESNEQSFYERMVKEAVHELGHTFGLTHCDNQVCVMHFSNSLRDTDIKDRSFCKSCRSQLLWT
jgi:archaemetzincin